ncbi:hypothetical protein BHE90_017365 [Fusarium euwallaceae]|uniref:Uncharacterized protein n=2 Tax=Fusarium solani species complex TaxID=232080 RepID=A0A430KXQ7_9HYPO|nr:hypothetical protein CDV31_017398 [Fusarium ambrosium]RTE68258.1 hypothetical protein BHE90_017365 [Fusarium euwallaceae]
MWSTAMLCQAVASPCLPPGYVEEFDEFTCNKSAKMEGVAYDDGVNAFVQVMQPGGRGSSLWSPSGSDSTTALVLY